MKINLILDLIIDFNQINQILFVSLEADEIIHLLRKLAEELMAEKHMDLKERMDLGVRISSKGHKGPMAH
jgi:hypothetical protein